VGAVTATDFDPVFVADVEARMVERWRFRAFSHDLVEGPVEGSFDAIFALDVLEHIDPALEMTFLRNAFAPLTQYGVAIIGTPSLEGQAHASMVSKAGHVNCKTMPELKRTMQHLFHNVFLFGMNDEVVHTGYHKMAHYLFAVACSKK
jgi:2-polyprenyl-3-methyl-5-hydroxy-6-metoxy-1,4-benzoquinol methylase